MRAFYFFIFLFLGNCLLGQTQFQKTFGNQNGNQGNTVILTNSGGYAIAGWYDVEGLFSAEFYLINLDANGDTLWTRTYGEKIDTAANFLNGSGNEGFNVIQTQDNGFFFVGERHRIPDDKSDVFAVKVDENGNLQWDVTYGGDGNDYGIATQQTAEGDFIIGGYTETFGLGIRNMYLLKLDNAGNLLWTKTFGGSGIDAVTDIIQTATGDLILAGYTFSFGAGNSDLYVIKTDAEGDLIWQKTFGGELKDIGQAIAPTADGGYIITGESDSFTPGHTEALLVKIDGDGNLEWSKTFGGEGFDAARSVQQTADGGYILAGYSRSFEPGDEDFYFIKTDATGNLEWAKTFGGTSDDLAQSVKQTIDGGYILTGYTRSFGIGSRDIYLIKTDEAGESGCHDFPTETIENEVTLMESIPNSDIFAGAELIENVTNVGFTNTSATDPCEIVNIDNLNETYFVNIFPSPTNQYLNIEVGGNYSSDNEIVIFDVFGKEVLRTIFRNKTDISALNNGIYFLSIEINDRQIIKKIVKQ